MKKSDKLKKQRYGISMRIIDMEAKAKSKALSKNEEKELEILKIKESELDERIENL